MKYTHYFILFSFIFLGCEKPDPETQKNYLSGYWEIKTVTMPDGETKNYDINTVVDYIEIAGDSGIRTKVAPRFDGSFKTNGLAEDFVLKIENDSLRMYYQTPYDAWKETVIEAADSTLTVINRDHKIYTYSKFKKFDLK